MSPSPQLPCSSTSLLSAKTSACRPLRVVNNTSCRDDSAFSVASSSATAAFDLMRHLIAAVLLRARWSGRDVAGDGCIVRCVPNLELAFLELSGCLGCGWAAVFGRLSLTLEVRGEDVFEESVVYVGAIIRLGTLLSKFVTWHVSVLPHVFLLRAGLGWSESTQFCCWLSLVVAFEKDVLSDFWLCVLEAPVPTRFKDAVE